MTATGRFNWYELMTTDTTSARAFYGAVIGWTSEDVGQGAYFTFNTAEGGVAGLLKTPEGTVQIGAGAAWMGYIAVDDVDAYADRFRAAGGAIRRAASDIPGIGRSAMVADPQGAVIVLFKATPGREGAAPPALDAPGYPSWRELMTTDGPSAVDFYAGMFGWEKSTPYDMGPMGVYQLVAYDGADRGGIMTMPPQTPAPSWGYYFKVESVAAATERLKAAGGAVINGPMQVPTGDWVVQATDPQGAHFGLQSVGA